MPTFQFGVPAFVRHLCPPPGQVAACQKVRRGNLARCAFRSALPLFPLARSCSLEPSPPKPPDEPFRGSPGDGGPDEQMLRAIYTAALTTSPAYEQLRELTTKFPGRLSGSKNLEGAVLWGEAVL